MINFSLFPQVLFSRDDLKISWHVAERHFFPIEVQFPDSGSSPSEVLSSFDLTKELFKGKSEDLIPAKCPIFNLPISLLCRVVCTETTAEACRARLMDDCAQSVTL